MICNNLQFLDVRYVLFIHTSFRSFMISNISLLIKNYQNLFVLGCNDTGDIHHLLIQYIDVVGPIMKPVFPNKVLAIFNEMVFCNWWSTVNLAGWLGESHIHKGHHMDQLDEQKEQSHVPFIGLGEFSIEYHIILINLHQLFFCLVSFMWKKVLVSQYDLFNSLCTAAVWMKCWESYLKEKKREEKVDHIPV